MNNILSLYHGSENIIRRPVYGVGKPYNDYGLGFYCTLDNSMAKEWAVGQNRDGYSNRYSIDTANLKILDLQQDVFSILNWLAILVNNRTFDIQSDFGYEAIDYLTRFFLPERLDTFDIIVGYRADDSYFSYAQDFLNNIISVKTLSRAMSLGNLGVQYAVKSELAFNLLQFESYEVANANEWFPRKISRDTKARNDYQEIRHEKWAPGEIYMMQIIEQEIKNDDSRLRPNFTI